MRSLGLLVANLSVQVWQHAHTLHLAAMARNADGPLRFLERVYTHSRRDLLLAIIAGSALIALAMVMS
jgi:cobalt/nickel transport system permease protein